MKQREIFGRGRYHGELIFVLKTIIIIIIINVIYVITALLYNLCASQKLIDL